jgi:hypothetical protein
MLGRYSAPAAVTAAWIDGSFAATRYATFVSRR